VAVIAGGASVDADGVISNKAVFIDVIEAVANADVGEDVVLGGAVADAGGADVGVGSVINI
jgi:hypothetical protein